MVLSFLKAKNAIKNKKKGGDRLNKVKDNAVVKTGVFKDYLMVERKSFIK